MTEEVIRNLTPSPRYQAQPGNEKKEPLALESGNQKNQAEPEQPRYLAQPGNENREPEALLTSLSLLESATTHPGEPATYRVPAILAPLLQPLLTPEEWHATRVQAVRTIYQLWWEDSESSTTEQRREIIRLGLLAPEKEITVKVGDAMANGWVNKSRFSEALQLCEEILEIFPDYRIWGTIARAEKTLGMVEAAVSHYQLALELCPEDDIQRKAANLNNMAGIIAQQGEVTKAIALYSESLQLKETIGNVQGKAATLHQLAGIYAQQGEVTRAIALYEQSLQLDETIGDVQGKAATLHQLAGIYAQQGEVTRAIALYEQSLQLDETIGDVQGKAATLHCLAIIYAQQGEVTRAIALYEQSLQLYETIGDVQGKAATLHCLAIIYAQQGEVTKAIALYEQSLQLYETIGNVQGKAATLANMGALAFEQGDINRALELLKQAAQTLALGKAYIDLITVLGNLGVADETNRLVYLAQATWLSLRIHAPLVSCYAA